MGELRKQIGITSLTTAQLRKEQSRLKALLKNTIPNTKEWHQYNKELGAVNNRLNDLNGKGKQTTGVLGQIRGAASSILPAFGWAAIISAVLGGIKALWNFTKTVINARKEVASLTGTTGQELADLTSEIRATADAFDQDFNKVLISGNAFAKQMKEPVKEMLDEMNKGLAVVGPKGDEFLDQLEEYGPLFKSAGVSAEESIALMSVAIRDGVFSDKGADSVKEAMLRLREMPKAAEDAIKSLGPAGTEIVNQIKKGQITYFEGMQKISAEMNKLPQNSQQVGRILADVFGGPGEDAEGFVRSLAKVEGGLDEIIDKSDDSVKASLKLVEANEKLNKAWDKLIGNGTTTFDGITASVKLLIADGLIGAIEWIQKTRDNFIDVYNNFLPLRAVFQLLWGSIKSTFRSLKTFGVLLVDTGKVIIQSFMSVGKTIKAVWDAIWSGDFSKVKGIFKEGLGDIKKQIVKLKDNLVDEGVKMGTDWADAWTETIKGKIDKAPVKQEVEIKTKTVNEVENTGTGKPKQTIEDALKQLENKYATLRAKEKEEWAKTDDEKRISKEAFDIEMLEKEKQFLEEKKALLASYGQNTVAIDEQIADTSVKIKEEQLKQEEKLEKESNKNKEEREKESQKATNKIAQDFQDKLSENEINTYGQIAQAKEEALSRLKKAYEDGVISHEEYLKAVKEINNAALLENIKTTEFLIDQTFTVIDSLSQFSKIKYDKRLADIDAQEQAALKAAGDNAKKKEKIEADFAAKREKIEREAAKKQQKIDLAKTLAYGAVGAAKTIANLGWPMAIPALIAHAAKMAAEIAVIKSQSFATGGHTGSGGKYEPAGIVHRGEYVIPQEGMSNPTLAPYINAIELARKNNTLQMVDFSGIMSAMGNVRGFADGGYTSQQTTERVIEKQTTDPVLLATISRLSGILNNIERNGIQGVWDYDYHKTSTQKIQDIETRNTLE